MTAAAERLKTFLASVQRLEDAVVMAHNRRRQALRRALLQLVFGGVVGAVMAAVFALWVTS